MISKFDYNFLKSNIFFFVLDSPSSQTKNKEKFHKLCQWRILDPGRNVLIANSM